MQVLCMFMKDILNISKKHNMKKINTDKSSRGKLVTLIQDKYGNITIKPYKGESAGFCGSTKKFNLK